LRVPDVTTVAMSMKDGEAMRVLVSEFMSLDGVVQAPGGKQEDPSGGFRHGGWSIEFFDPDVMGAVVDEYARRSEVLLQGRRTYQVSATAWPERSGDAFSDWINGGKTLFPSDGEARTYELISAETAKTGVQVCRYRPGGD
jgi:hypothetical protein